MDHTSLLRYVSDCWKLNPLGRRVDQAQSFADVIQTVAGPRTDTPRSIPADPPPSAHAMSAPGPRTTPQRNDNQQALHDLSEALERRAAASGAVPPAKMLYTAARTTDSDTASARVQLFIDAD
jgi:hypothetical protein